MKNKKCIGVLSLFSLIIIGCATNAQLPLKESMAQTLIGTIWTMNNLDGEFENENEEDWQFIENGILITLIDGWSNNTWAITDSSVIIAINDNYAIYNFQVINNNLMKGFANNEMEFKWSVELRRKI